MPGLPSLMAFDENRPRLLVHGLRRVIGKHQAQRVFIVDGNPGMAAELRILRLRRHKGEERQQELIDPPIEGLVVVNPARGNTEAEFLAQARSEEHTSELQSLMRISYAVFCLKKKKNNNQTTITNQEK